MDSARAAKRNASRLVQVLRREGPTTAPRLGARLNLDPVQLGDAILVAQDRDQIDSAPPPARDPRPVDRVYSLKRWARLRRFAAWPGWAWPGWVPLIFFVGVAGFGVFSLWYLGELR